MSRRPRSQPRLRDNASPTQAPKAGLGGGFAAEIEQVILIGLSPSIAAHLMEPLRAVVRGANLQMKRRDDLGSPAAFPDGTLLVLQDARDDENGLETLRRLRADGVATPAILIVTGDDFECPADIELLGDLDVIPLAECSRFAFRRSLLLLGGQAEREKLTGESGSRLRAYERVLAAKDEERQRVLAVATALERRLSAAEAEAQKNDCVWAERLARADAYIAELEGQLDAQAAASKQSETAAAEAARRQRQRALELAFHRDERMQLDQTVAELRRRCAEREQELRQLKAERTDAGDLASRLEASERVRSAQTRELLAAQRRVGDLEQSLGTIATLLEAEEATAREDPGGLLEEVARRLMQVESARSSPQGREAYEELSRSLAVQQVDDTLDNAKSRRDAAQRVDEAVQRARRLGLPLLCLMIGIDEPHSLRREHGSVAFDFMLVRIAQRLQLTLRQKDVVMRYGEGEFLLISDAKTAAAARSHAKRLMRTVCAEPLQMGSREVEVSLSIAVVPLDEEMDGAPDLIRRARHGLLEAQSKGERQILVATGEGADVGVAATETDEDADSFERPYHHG